MGLITWLLILFIILGFILSFTYHYYQQNDDKDYHYLISETLRLQNMKFGNELLKIKIAHLSDQNSYVDKGVSLIGTHAIGSITWQCYQCAGTSDGDTCDYCGSAKKVI